MSRKLFTNPIHPYTRALLSAIPAPDPSLRRERILLHGELSSPIDPPDACRFAKRCLEVCPSCLSACPELREITPGHFVTCHRR